MRLRINLATRRYLNLRAINLSLLAGFALLGFLLLFKLQQMAYDYGELRRLEQSAELQKSARSEKTEVVGDAQYNALMNRIRFANFALEKKSVNWLAILDRLETVVPNGVALTQIEPELKKQQVRITGIARTFADLRVLMENLEQSPHFSEVYLLSQAETKVGMTQVGVSFSLNCRTPLQ